MHNNSVLPNCNVAGSPPDQRAEAGGELLPLGGGPAAAARRAVGRAVQDHPVAPAAPRLPPKPTSCFIPVPPKGSMFQNSLQLPAHAPVLNRFRVIFSFVVCRVFLVFRRPLCFPYFSLFRNDEGQWMGYALSNQMCLPLLTGTSEHAWGWSGGVSCVPFVWITLCRPE